MSRSVALSVGEKPPDEWAALERGASLFARRSWIEALDEEAVGASAVWAVATGSRPEVGLFGHLARDPGWSAPRNPWSLLFGFEAGVVTLTDDERRRRATLGAEAPAAKAWFPALVFTYPGLECFPIGPGAASREAVGELVAESLAWARERRLALVAFLYVPPEQELLASVLDEAGLVRVPVAVRANLTLPGSSFEDYCAELSANQRSALRRTRRNLEEAGVRIVERSLSQRIDEVVRLRCALRRKYGRSVDEAAERGMVARVAAELAGEITLFSAEASSTVLSFCLMVWDGSVWHAFMTGTDHDDPRSRDAYFEVMYYTPIEAAYEREIAELSFGFGTEETKRRRGCRLEPVHAWLAPLTPELDRSVREVAKEQAGAEAPAVGR